MEKKNILLASYFLLIIAIVWGFLKEIFSGRITFASSLSLFTKDYFSWIISLKELFTNNFYLGLSNKILFLIKTGYYLLFTIGIIILIIALINKLKDKKYENVASTTSKPLIEKKSSSDLDELITQGNNKMKIKDINGAKKIYEKIKEKTKDKNYSKEQYNQIIDLYKKITA